MSLLSGLFTELEKVSAPRFVVTESVARTERVPAVHLEHHQQPITERTPALKNQHGAPGSTLATRRSETEAFDDEPQHFIQTAITASPEWLAARDALYLHLMPCRSCYAPMGRYCSAGTELRQRYDLTPMV